MRLSRFAGTASTTRLCRNTRRISCYTIYATHACQRLFDVDNSTKSANRLFRRQKMAIIRAAD